MVVLKSHIYWLSGRTGQVVQRKIRLVSINWHELSLLSLESRMRRIYPHGLSKRFGSKYWEATMYNDRHLKKDCEYSSWNVTSITTKMNMLVQISRHVNKQSLVNEFEKISSIMRCTIYACHCVFTLFYFKDQFKGSFFSENIDFLHHLFLYIHPMNIFTRFC